MGSSKVASDLASGTVAGAAQLVVGHPFDTIKVKLQSGGQFNGPLDAAKQTLKKEGFRGFFKGMGAPLATVAAFNAVLFTSRGFMQSILAHKDGSPLTVSDQALAGAGAGAAAALVAAPTELLKCRLQAQGEVGVVLQRLAAAGIDPKTVKIYHGPLDVVNHVVMHEGGISGLFRGTAPTLLREVPGNVIMFGTYEGLKRLFAQQQGLSSTSELSSWSLMCAGAVGGGAFWALTYPMDMIKSKIQVDDVHNPAYRGIADTAAKLYRAEGVRGLYRGFAPCVVRAFPANGAAFVVYEMVSKLLDRPWSTAAKKEQIDIAVDLSDK